MLNKLIIKTHSVDVFFNEYGRETVVNMIMNGRLASPKRYDNYTLTSGNP